MNTLWLCLCALSCMVFLGANGQYCQTTSAATEGPYYKSGAPFRSDKTVCEYQRIRNGTQVMIRGRVYSNGCRTGVPALLDVWSANPAGVYSSQGGSDYTCRGKVLTDANGYYQFLTTYPGRYRQGNGYRPSHIHFKVTPYSQSTRNTLTTQLYFRNDPTIQQDVCDYQTCHAGDPTLTFPLQSQNAQSYMLRFDVVFR